MHTLLAAPFAYGNPVQSLLYSRTAEAGFSLLTRHGFPLARDLEKATVVHLGWTDSVTSGRSPQSDIEERVDRHLAAISSARRRGTRFVFTLHNSAPRHRFGREVGDQFISRLLSAVDVVHLFDERHLAIANKLAGNNSLNHVVIRHPLYPVHAMQRTEAPSRSGVHRPIRIAALGWLRPDKRLSEFIEIVDSLANRIDEEVHLVIAGSPMMSPSGFREAFALVSRGLRSRRVTVRPWRQTNKSFAATMASCDIAVVGDVGALNSGTVFLALSLGLRVVGPELAVPNVLAGHPRIGLIRTRGDLIATICSQVHAAATTEDAPAYEHLLSEHNPNHVAARFRDLVATLKPS